MSSRVIDSSIKQYRIFSNKCSVDNSEFPIIKYS